MRRPRRRWLLIVVPYLFVAGAGTYGLHLLEDEAHQRCLDRQTDRQVLRQVVDIATTTSGGGQLDLTIVPGFDDLDPQTQTFITNLSHAISSEPPSTRNALHDELLNQLPSIDC